MFDWIKASVIKPLLLLAVFCAVAMAQTGTDSATVRRLRADVEFLSSNGLEGRLSLSRGADVAAHYIAAEFQRLGLTPVTGTSFFQEFPLVAYEIDRERTHLALLRNGKAVAFHEGADFRGGFWREVAIKAPVVFVGYGITAPEYRYDDYAGIEVRGKVVLAFDHEPQETDPRSVFNGTGHTRHGNSRVKVENAQRHGAVAVLIVGEPLRKHAGAFDVRLSSMGVPVRAISPRQAIEEGAIPWFQVSDQTAAELLQPFGKTPADLEEAVDRDLKPASMVVSDTVAEITVAPVNVRHQTSLNVLGLLEGSDPVLRSETVMITAHYDHLGVQNNELYPGANDNATGSAAVMELARFFSANSSRPRRSILFAVFGSEEEGLLGSYYYVAHPLRRLETTRAALNLDMIGRDEAHIPQSRGVVDIPADTTNQINLVGVFYSPDLRAAILKANEKVGLDISTKFDQDHDLNALFRCDHFPFLLRDVPAAWFFGGWHPGYHEPIDTVEKLNFVKFEKVTWLAYWTARSVADSSKPLRFGFEGRK